MNAGNAMDASGGAVVGAINDVLQPTANMMIKKKTNTVNTNKRVYSGVADPPTQPLQKEPC